MEDLIKAVLDEQNWKYLESGGTIRLDVEGESASWSSFIRPENDGCFAYYSILPAKAEEERIKIISELIHRINFLVRIGDFEINLSDGSARGQILFKTYGLITETLVKDNPDEAKEIIRRTIAYNMLTMDYYSKTLFKVIYGNENNIGEILKFTERGEQI